MLLFFKITQHTSGSSVENLSIKLFDKSKYERDGKHCRNSSPLFILLSIKYSLRKHGNEGKDDKSDNEVFDKERDSSAV